ncbi:MAG: GtrA family protein [Butyrivibrio sp.]
MKELLLYIRKLDFKNIFVTATSNPVIQFFRYVFVGGISFVADSGSLFILEHIGLYYLVAASIAFIIGLVCNFFLSKLLVFHESKTDKRVEFLVYGLIGLIGLGITEACMYLLTDIAGMYFMLSKILVAVLVLIWNFAARKLILYRKK